MAKHQDEYDGKKVWNEEKGVWEDELAHLFVPDPTATVPFIKKTSEGPVVEPGGPDLGLTPPSLGPRMSPHVRLVEDTGEGFAFPSGPGTSVPGDEPRVAAPAPAPAPRERARREPERPPAASGVSNVVIIAGVAFLLGGALAAFAIVVFASAFAGF